MINITWLIYNNVYFWTHKPDLKGMSFKDMSKVAQCTSQKKLLTDNDFLRQC